MSSEASVSGLRVLVIEDEALVSMLLEDMILDAGHKIAAILTDLAVALDYVAQDGSMFDVAVLDVNLAGQPSFPIADALAASRKPFVFSTGYGRDGLPEVWRDRPLLAKPFGAQSVVAALDTLAKAFGRP